MQHEETRECRLERGKKTGASHVCETLVRLHGGVENAGKLALAKGETGA